MDRSTARAGLAAALALAAFAFAGCGDDGSDDPGGSPSADEWREQVNGFCSDGYREATALPPPQNARQLGPDATARAEIVAEVRDGIAGLGQPDGISSEDVGGYVDELDADIDQLTRIADEAKAGRVDPEKTQLDESAGQAAGELGLDECAALSEAIARTP